MQGKSDFDLTPRSAQKGLVAVEFALVAIVFLTFVLGIIETSRAMYILNTLPMVTKNAARAAANTDWRDSDAMARVRQQALFRSTAGTLAWGDPITDANVKIDYLSLARQSDGSLTMTPITSLPSCPSRNRQTCLADPNNPSCIRLVRVRICRTGNSSDCDPVPYRTLLSLVAMNFSLPTSPSIVSAESLGYQVGAPVCP
ncbi:pilus assembly protein [Massilia solisilvae]|uniref:Pilus assembly protein n=1 Tax=Massilia solisilvae TaxID=1811225 RepID=A0ABT2BNB0_9BURK|nr:TadE/TadG family type IV pilus assembly protein [Massilia solisilvae]MCS0609979.1 pilus assembly protein [Massilia solisilvae]